MGKLKYSTLIDYILCILSIVAETGSNKYVSLVSLLNSLAYKTSFGRIQEIGKYLDTKGWAKIIFLLGDVKAQIAPRGLVYLEDKSLEFQDGVKSFLENILLEKGEKLEDFIMEISEPNDDPKKNMFNLINVITTKIRKQNDNDPDILKDFEVIKIELSKSFPDFQLLEIKLNKLGTLDYISSEVQELKDYLLVPAN